MFVDMLLALAKWLVEECSWGRQRGGSSGVKVEERVL